MKEFDELQDETSKREMEYQKLLQEYEVKLQEVAKSRFKVI